MNELKAKLEALSASVSHTAVKEAKERHLTSKALKADLQILANRRFQRAKEVATERVITILRLWSQREFTHLLLTLFFLCQFISLLFGLNC